MLTYLKTLSIMGSLLLLPLFGATGFGEIDLSRVGEIDFSGFGEKPTDSSHFLGERQEFIIEFPEAVNSKTTYAGYIWDVLDMNETVSYPKPGSPRVPVQVLSIKSTKTLTNIDVNYGGQRIKKMDLVPSFNCISPYSTMDVEVVDENAYASDHFFPQEEYLFELTGGIWENGIKFWEYSLVLFPVKYNAVLEVARIYSRAQVTLHSSEKGYSSTGEHILQVSIVTMNGEMDRKIFSIGDSDVRPLDRKVPGTIDPRDTRVDDPDPEYLIITTSALSGSVGSLADWKTQKGIPTAVATVETIYSTYQGVDDPEKIKNYIKDMHSQYNIKYVLLAGDYQDIPVRLCKDSDPADGWDDGWLPADKYYACLDGTWDADGDGIWGETGDITDKIADVYLTRIAIESYSTLSSWCSDIIGYERSPPSGDWMEGAILIGADSFQDGDGAVQSDYLYNNYLDTVFPSPVKYYENGGSISRTNVYYSICDGAGYLNFIDHGGPDVWCQDDGNGVVLINQDVSALSNGNRMPLVNAMACLTNWFDDPSGCGYGAFTDCIGEKFTENLNGGGIGYIGSSRSAVAVIGANQYVYGAGGLQEDVCRQLNYGRRHIGQVYIRAMNYYASAWGAWFGDSENVHIQDCWVEMNMLGEPEVPLWTAQPRDFDIFTSSTPSHCNITVRDMDTNDPVSGARVCLMNDNVYLKGTTNSLGTISFDNPLNENEATLTVSKQNFIPDVSTFTFLDDIPSVTEFSITPEEPDGLRGWYNSTPTINLTSELWVNIYYKYSDEMDYHHYTGSLMPREGDNVLQYYSVDQWGNEEEVSTREIMVDTIPSSIEMGVTPTLPNGLLMYYNSTPIINFTTLEDDTDIFFRLLLDDQSPSGFEEYSAPFWPDEEGVIMVEFYCIDRAGNYGKIEDEEIRIDTVSPGLEVLMPPCDGENGWYRDIPDIELVSSDLEDYIYYYYSTFKDRKIYTGNIELEEGNSTMYCVSQDRAGNWGEVVEVQIKIDTEAPDIFLMVDPEMPDGLNGYYNTTPRITFPVDDNLTIFYSWNQNTMKEYSTGNSIVPPLQGYNQLEYYAIDQAGNSMMTREYELMVDTISGSTEIILEPEESNGEKGWYTTLEIKLSSETGERENIYYYFDDDEEISRYRTGITDSDIPQGIHTLYFFTVDIAGNTEKTKAYEIKFDSEKPKARLECDSANVVPGKQITFYAFLSTDGTGDLRYKIDYGDGECSPYSARSNLTHEYSKAGRYTVTLWVQDEAGHTSTPVKKLVVVGKAETNIGFFSWGWKVMVAIALGLIIGGLLIVVKRRKKIGVVETAGSEPIHEIIPSKKSNDKEIKKLPPPPRDTGKNKIEIMKETGEKETGEKVTGEDIKVNKVDENLEQRESIQNETEPKFLSDGKEKETVLMLPKKNEKVDVAGILDGLSELVKKEDKKE